MRQRSAELILVVMAVLSGIVVLPAAAQSPEPCRDVSLPTPVVESLNTKFPDWRPKEVSDLAADDQQLWLKAHPKGCPGIAVGHFESFDKLAYAALLVPKSRANGGYKIIMFKKGQRNNGYSWSVLAHAATEIDSGMVISTAPPGKYPAFGDEKSVTLKLDGLYVEVIEKGIELYFWSGGGFRRIQIWD